MSAGAGGRGGGSGAGVPGICLVSLATAVRINAVVPPVDNRHPDISSVVTGFLFVWDLLLLFVLRLINNFKITLIGSWANIMFPVGQKNFFF